MSALQTAVFTWMLIGGLGLILASLFVSIVALVVALVVSIIRS